MRQRKSDSALDAFTSRPMLSVICHEPPRPRCLKSDSCSNKRFSDQNFALSSVPWVSVLLPSTEKLLGVM